MIIDLHSSGTQQRCGFVFRDLTVPSAPAFRESMFI
jgi:hypothetical protein